jgi:hypothetical protein
MKTTAIAVWIAAELARLPGSHAPGETRDQYNQRAAEISTALAEEAVPYANGMGWSATELAAAGAVIWYSETLLDKRVHAGEQHPVWTQDHGLAHCGFQLHVSGLVPLEVWERLAGLDADATHLCARYGLRVVVAQAHECGVFSGVRADRNRVAKTFASFASGGKCVPSDRDWQRADLWLKMMASRPDNSKKTLPGYRRVGPLEVPEDVRMSADGIVDTLSAAWPKANRAHVGDTFTPTEPKFANYKLLVEKHAEGKIGVSIFVKE